MDENAQFLDDLTQLVQAGLIVVEVDQVDDEPRFNLTAQGRAETQRAGDESP